MVALCSHARPAQPGLPTDLLATLRRRRDYGTIDSVSTSRAANSDSAPSEAAVHDETRIARLQRRVVKAQHPRATL